MFLMIFSFHKNTPINISISLLITFQYEMTKTLISNKI
jgi:hypothetical protein